MIKIVRSRLGGQQLFLVRVNEVRYSQFDAVFYYKYAAELYAERLQETELPDHKIEFVEEG